MSDYVDKPASAGRAWYLSRAFAGTDVQQALRWLERAHRLAPSEMRVVLDLANIRVSTGVAAQIRLAETEFAMLAARYDFAGAWLGLMTVRRLLGAHGPAAAALGSLLSRHCMPQDDGFETIARMVAADAGFPGWCALTMSGTIRIDAEGPCDVRLDGKPFRQRKAVPATGMLSVTAGAALLGSPLDLRAMRHLEGIVSVDGAGLRGWAVRPGAADATPEVRLTDARQREINITCGAVLPAAQDAPFAKRYEFFVGASALRDLVPPFRLGGADNAMLLGSPIDPGAQAVRVPVPATFIGPVRQRMPARRPLAVVVPVYRGLKVTQSCLASLFAALPPRAKVIVVDDAGPEPALAAWLDTLAVQKKITLQRNAQNLGFPATVNAGIALAGNRDVLLLNSDTLIPAGAIEAMIEIAYADPSTGTVTPFSNEATILSYPQAQGGNPPPDAAGTAKLHAQAVKANGLKTVEIPTAIGFCMYIRADCLRATGPFDSALFAQGYGEEVDFCLRARRLGYRHMAATGIFVTHMGGVSFGAAGRALNERNGDIINRLAPGYDEMIGAFVKADPLAPARLRLDIARFRAARAKRGNGAVLLISHRHGGGVSRQVATEMAAIRASGRRAILLVPFVPDDQMNTPFPWDAQLSDGGFNDYPNLRFDLATQLPALLRLLQPERIAQVVLHHSFGHHAAVREIAALLGLRQDIVIHDYASFCPRINLLTQAEAKAPLRYCGEPNVDGCIACVARAGDDTEEGLGIKKLLARSKREFAQARSVTAPSADAARRVGRHFPGLKPAIIPWEDDGIEMQLKPPGTGTRNVVIVGGIGPAKGFDVLVDCARDAARRGLKLKFIIAGHSAKDEDLLAEGIFLTGRYLEGSATALLKSLNVDLAFLPSIWPETWCFALSEAWRAGLYTAAFDLGAQADRIRATGRGFLLPLGLPAERINDLLLSWRPR